MTLSQYAAALRRRWRIVVVCLILAVGGAALVISQLTPRYESTARLFVATEQESSAEAFAGGAFAVQRVLSYATLVDGEELAIRVVDKLGLEESPSDLSQDLTATVVPQTVILELSAKADDPAEAQRIADSAATELVAWVRELEATDGQSPAIKLSVSDRAVRPDAPITPVPLRDLGLAALVGLLLGLLLAVLRELLDKSVKTSEEASRLGDTPVLAAIAQDRKAVRTPLVSDLSPGAPRAEAFRILRTNLQFVDVDKDLRVLVVSSPMPGEGKTSTAANLALTLHAAGGRVLLVDADLRRPGLASLFALEGSVGLTSVLLGRIGLTEATQRHSSTGLAVLTSGAVPPNPAELLQSRAMRQLLDQARRDHDVVIIDAPPLLPVADAALVAAQADGAVLVVRHGKTTRDQLTHAMQRLRAVGARPLGVTLNMAPSRRRDGYGGSGMYYQHDDAVTEPSPSVPVTR